MFSAGTLAGTPVDAVNLLGVPRVVKERPQVRRCRILRSWHKIPVVRRNDDCFTLKADRSATTRISRS